MIPAKPIHFYRGTSIEAVRIQETGFRVDLAGTNASALLGAGATTSMEKALHYAKSREANGIVLELEIDLGRCNDLHPGDPMRTWQERGYGSACPSESEVWNACAKFCFRIWLTSFSLRMSE